VASQIGKATQKSLPQMVPAGRHGFRDDTENSDQDSAIDELMAMHIRKNALFIINKALALAALARIEIGSCCDWKVILSLIAVTRLC
jgi:hypothetical protein